MKKIGIFCRTLNDARLIKRYIYNMIFKDYPNQCLNFKDNMEINFIHDFKIFIIPVNIDGCGIRVNKSYVQDGVRLGDIWTKVLPSLLDDTDLIFFNNEEKLYELLKNEINKEV